MTDIVSRKSLGKLAFIGLFFVFVLCFTTQSLLAYDVHIVATADTNYVLLVWSHDSTFDGYNIYRRTVGRYVKLNSSPIRLMTDCRAIRNLIPPGSREWDMIRSVADTSPCYVHTLPETLENRWKALRLLAVFNLKIGIFMGQAFADSTALPGTTYWYAIRGVDSHGRESAILDSVRIEAGRYRSPGRPTGMEAHAGDARVMVRWNGADRAVGYIVMRSKSRSGPWIRVNEMELMTQCTVGVRGERLPTSKVCFTDFMHWDSLGDPSVHVVNGVSVSGPYNDTTYYYRVRAVDIFGRLGPYSSIVSAIPRDETPPQPPTDVILEARGDTLVVCWTKVTRDRYGHPEIPGVKEYKVYRADSMTDTLGTLVASHVHQPGGDTTQVCFKDHSPDIKPEYGEKVFYYRVRTIDWHNNVSPISAAAGGYIPDTIPPDPPKNLKAEGYGNFIKLTWSKNTEQDLAGYKIYRGICGGETVKVVQVEKRTREYRPYPLHLVATIDNPDSTVYKDYGVPEGSPICYRYAVKAYDKKENISDTSRTVCEKLREGVPPPPPIIVGLKARQKAILVEWVSPPVQDLFGFIVERSSDSVHWERVSPELHFPEHVSCEDIPPVNRWAADSVFSFLDKNVEPKKLYLYRVRGADYTGNIGEPSAEMATYTFDFKGPPKPRITAVSPVSGKPFLRVTWSPAYNSSLLGFVVFRKAGTGGKYIQVSDLIKGNEFLDKKVRRGITYWYRVQCLQANGNRSEPSDPVSGALP